MSGASVRGAYLALARRTVALVAARFGVESLLVLVEAAAPLGAVPVAAFHRVALKLGRMRKALRELAGLELCVTTDVSEAESVEGGEGERGKRVDRRA